MQYLDRFVLASADDEVDFILSPHNHKLNMSCYSDHPYPFQIFPQKGLERIDFEPITVFYGGNGSGKSTLLNAIAQKLHLQREAPFNDTPFYEVYVDMCRYELDPGVRKIPAESRIITSDEVFDFLLNIRVLNQGLERSREELFEEYYTTRKNQFTLRSLKDYEELKRNNEANRSTKSQYTAKRMPGSVCGKSNGESGYLYFTEKVRENALYLLDEPENSLSAELQMKLAQFLEDSARFYGCQFVISTHSPFLLAMKGARIYDLDSVPVKIRKWTELDAVRIYHDFFEKHRELFAKED
jgi:predicted ATPase